MGSVSFRTPGFWTANARTRLVPILLELKCSQCVVLGLSKIEHAIEASDLEDFMNLSSEATKLQPASGGLNFAIQ